VEITESKPFIEFERTSRRRLGELNLTPLIDILFILIIFFMLTTSFMRVESMELVLPSAAGKAVAKNDMVHLFLYANGDMAIGQRRLDQEELSESLARMFSNDPEAKVMMLTADGVTMQQLVGIMDKVYLAGGKSLFVRKWEAAPAGSARAMSAELVKPEKPPVAPVKLFRPAAPAGNDGRPKADIRDLYGE
jgi:biopolymer transport protein ExbD